MCKEKVLWHLSLQGCGSDLQATLYSPRKGSSALARGLLEGLLLSALLGHLHILKSSRWESRSKMKMVAVIGHSLLGLCTRLSCLRMVS